MDQKIIDLYDAYTHGAVGRRDFLDRLAQIAGGAAALLGVLQNDYAHARSFPRTTRASPRKPRPATWRARRSAATWPASRAARSGRP